MFSGGGIDLVAGWRGSLHALEALRSLASDRERVETLGEGALAFAQDFTWDRAAERTEAHLAEVAGNG